MGMKLIMLAPPVRQGTQAEILSAKLGIPTISTGNILRAAIKDGTPIGSRPSPIWTRASWSPTRSSSASWPSAWLSRLRKRLHPGRGAPHHRPAEALDQAGVTFDHVLSIEISDAEIEERMEGRRVCSTCGAPYHIHAKPPKQEGICDSCGGVLMQRDDDRPETVRHRLEVYHSETEPLKGYYESKGILNPIRISHYRGDH